MTPEEPLPFAVAPKGSGQTIEQLVFERARTPQQAREIIALLSGWSRCLLELGREPTVSEYAGRFKMATSTAYRALDIFRVAFPTETMPTRLCRLIDDAVPTTGQHWAAWLDGRLVERPAEP